MLLSILIWLPALVALLIALAPAGRATLIARIGATATFMTSLLILGQMGELADGFWALEKHAWIPNLGISYSLGVDGVSGMLVVLTAFLTVLTAFVPLRVFAGREKLFFGALLGLEATLIGAFSALDLILFYLFFEVCLVPVYFLMGVFGGPNRAKTALKFFIYTVVGSLAMLASVLVMGMHVHSFAYADIRLEFSGRSVPLLFLGLAVAFAVKTPLFPFHSWQAETYAETPTAAVVIVAGAMAKLGTYGLYRFGTEMLPHTAKELAPIFLALATVSIVYGAMVAIMQRDIKRLLAYSSLSHLGFVVLGIFSFRSEGITGANFQMISHGLTTGGLFLVAAMLEDRVGTLKIRKLGGLWDAAPFFTRVFLILTLASVALPLTSSFVGEFLILVGTFQTAPVYAAIATSGVILSAIYMLWMFQRVVYGTAERDDRLGFTDVDEREKLVLGTLVVLVLLFGVLPGRLLTYINPDNELERSIGNGPIPPQSNRGGSAGPPRGGGPGGPGGGGANGGSQVNSSALPDVNAPAGGTQ